MRSAILTILCLFCMLTLVPVPALCGTSPQLLELAMSDTLDLWREGRFEQLFDRLAHRGGTSREAFVRRMGNASRRPACCFQKMRGFRVVKERESEATVSATIGLEGGTSAGENCTREFRMTLEGGNWKIQLNDIYSLAGVTGRKR
jgi:hypothetical protein